MISKETVEKIADLARLDLSKDEIAGYSNKLSAILKHFDELNQLDTSNVEPLTTPTLIESYMQEDVLKQSTEDMLSNAPEKSGNLYKVPPVV